MDNDKTKKSSNESEIKEILGEPVVVKPEEDNAVSTEGNDDSKPSAPVEDSKVDTDKDSADEIKTGEKVEDNADDDVESETERHLKEAIAEQAREDERPHSSNFTLRKVLGGDILTAQMLRNNIWLIVLIVGFIVLYITNRYKVQKDLLEIDKLKTELDDAKYRALSSSSNLTEKSRESHVIESLKNSPDSSLKQSDRPPYIIEVPEK